MSEPEKINLSKLKKLYKEGLLIPEIQRDYVMGAGGKKKGHSKDKLTELLDAILNSFKAEKDFDFSCIITFSKEDENSPLEIYDGQQRLTTLFLLVLYCLQREAGEKYKEYSNWYRFSGRPVANGIIDKLTNEKVDLADLKVKDFSSFSMKNLLEKFSDPKYDCITSDYLLNKVKFDRVTMGSQSEIEQFFMDLNSGITLKDYELYKAKLIYQIKQLLKSSKVNEDDKMLEKGLFCLDNEWLDMFEPFADFLHPAEEYEISFIKYCLRMLRGKNVDEDDISKLDLAVLNKCFLIMKSVSKLDFSSYKRNDTPQVIKFSWEDPQNDDKYLQDGMAWYFNERGAYWNLNYEDNKYYLYFIIKNILLKHIQDKELYNDIIIWAYITTLEWSVEYQREYIRILKVLLNYNITINEKAWYPARKDSENKEIDQKIYYSRYCVCYIPQYYGKHIENSPEPKNDDVFKNICAMVQDFGFKYDRSFKRLLNKKRISELVMDEILKIYSDPNNIIKRRREQLKNEEDYDVFYEKENNNNGILVNKQIEELYVKKVKLLWPTMGNSSSTVDNCYVLMDCNMDKLYEESGENEKKDKIEKDIRDYVLCLKQVTNDMNIEVDVKKCFYKNEGTIETYKLKDRANSQSKTYLKNGSLSEDAWAQRLKIGDNKNKVFKIGFEDITDEV